MRSLTPLLGFARSFSILALVGVLGVPALAHATGSGGDPGGDVGSGDGGAGSGGTSADGTGGGTSTEPPATTGEDQETTGGATEGSGETEGSGGPETDEGGCSIGSRDTAPGLMLLGLFGLAAIRRRNR